MDFPAGRLRAALAAGGIPITDNAIAALASGLRKAGHQYRIDRLVKTISPRRMFKELTEMAEAANKMGSILDKDLAGTREIEMTLDFFCTTGPGLGAQYFAIADFGHRLHHLQDTLQQVCIMLKSDLERRKQDMARHHQEPETGLFWFCTGFMGP